MKKNQYIAAIACLAAGIIGFGSVYVTEQAQERQEAQQLAEQDTQGSGTEADEIEETSGIVEPKQTSEAADEDAGAKTGTTAQDKSQTEAKTGTTAQDKSQTGVKTGTSAQESAADSDGAANNIEETAAAEDDLLETSALADSLHFLGTEDLVWPLEGNVILDYSMDSTIYFPTLEQYRYNPALVISGSVNDKVYLIAKGQITDISENEVTGLTVTENLGDGYTAIYGQLTELNFAVGDLVEAGQVIGYVSEPTKYYSVEGSNLYFEMQKDGEPVNPLDFFE